MNFNEICKIALEFSKQPCINSIVKIKGGFLFGFSDNEGRDLFINPVYVSDNGRQVNSYLPMEHNDEILYEVVIPDEFRAGKKADS